MTTVDNDVTEAYELVELATMLLPEAEGIDISDKEYDLEDLAVLRMRAASIRHACDVVSRALANEWKRLGEHDLIELDGNKHWLGTTKRMEYQDEEKALAFAEWLKEQDAETIVKILPKKPGPIRKTSLGAARDSFFKDVSEGSESIQSKPL